MEYQTKQPYDEERQAPALPMLQDPPKADGGTSVGVIDLLGMPDAAAAMNFEAARVDLTLRPAILTELSNNTLPGGRATEAHEPRVNLSQAVEVGRATAMASSRQEQWVAENQHALDSSNAFVEQHGVPLARYRHP